MTTRVPINLTFALVGRDGKATLPFSHFLRTVATQVNSLTDLSGSSDDITEGSTNLFLSAAQETKLTGIEDGATADQSAAEIKTAYESNADTNAFDDAAQTKLSNIETAATADQSDAEIKTAYENNADTNAFTDTEKTKLSNIETSATADQTDAEILTAWETETGIDDADIVLRDGSIPLTGPLELESYTVAGAPSAGTAARVIYVSDGDAGSPCLAVDNGTNWLRVSLGAAISAT